MQFPNLLPAEVARKVLEQARQRPLDDLLPVVDEAALESLKFSDCLPTDLAIRLLQIRLRDAAGIRHALQSPQHFVSS